MAQKSREEGEIGSESREMGDLPPVPPLPIWIDALMALIWENTYKTTLQPIFILQKKAMRIITFSRFEEHSSPLSVKSLEIINFLELVTF